MTRLVVVCGLPGTGKTTLAGPLASELGAAYLRVDVAETPLISAGIDVGGLGYEIVRELAASNLAVGVGVVVDLVNPWPLTRAMWRETASAAGVPLVVFECVLGDATEHRRRVEDRSPDLPGQVVPTWKEVVGRDYAAWDEDRDGPRTRIDTTDAAAALARALEVLTPGRA